MTLPPNDSSSTLALPVPNVMVKRRLPFSGTSTGNSEAKRPVPTAMDSVALVPSVMAIDMEPR